jgi:hypothetical protein
VRTELIVATTILSTVALAHISSSLSKISFSASNTNVSDLGNDNELIICVELVPGGIPFGLIKISREQSSTSDVLQKNIVVTACSPVAKNNLVV